ncbi:MAG: 4Fe-4S dicluster domain-containing protein, partial [Solirubrobacteraceae bacterium]
MPAFDPHRPPEQSVIEDCVHCGFCLDTCPTYVLWGAEADSPRGRIVLMKEGLEGEAGMSDEMVSHFDRCLGCMACVSACPSGVQYDRLIERVRPQVERNHERSRAERALRRLLYETLPHPQRLRALVPLLAAGRRLGADRRLPERLAVLAKVAPRT